MSSFQDDTEEEVSWRGCSMEEIYRNLNEFELKHVPPVRPSDAHTVLYYYPIKNFDEPPKPLKGHGKWDALHVRLPCSSRSQYPVTKSDGTVTIESRWEMIEQALLRPINNSRELEAAILSYNSKYQSIWKFKSLHKLFEEELDEDESNAFFQQLLPKIIRLALRLPELIQTAIPLLKQGQNRSVSFSQQQVACLLANAFLCTYPRRNTLKKKSEYSSFPDINFNRLFQSTGPQVIEKIKAICHYFRRVCRKTPLGVVTMTRRSMTESELPKWNECSAPLGVTPLHISSCGTIEDQGRGLLQVDFANKFLGGGVLGGGCVQEEIRFVICPELIVSKLFTEALRPNEALIMVGCEQFSKYAGYASTFTWDGNYEDSTPFDESRRRQCHIVAIDALFFVESSHQYQEELMLRELNKAYVGFFHTLDTPAPGVASGNWGCGAFGGEAKLKALLQLMACTVTKRPLVYFTFGNVELRDGIHNIHTFFIENNVTVKDLWSYLRKFRDLKISPTDLYSFICHIHRDSKKDKNLIANSLQEILPKIARGNLVSNRDDKSDAKIIAPLQETDEYSKMMQKEIEECQDLFADMSSPELFDKNDVEEDFQKNVKELKKSPILLMVGKSVSENVNNTKKLNKFAKADAKQKCSDAKGHDKKKDKPESRQRTLLEMLDVCYTGSPAKRNCFSGKLNS